MLDQRLIKNINRGRCFVLVGSGPSCEIGYPSWHVLAEKVYKLLQDKGLAKDSRSYETYLKQKKYPELFRLAESDIGNRNDLINAMKDLLKPAHQQRGYIYEMIAQWPFACYLTTNFDNELSRYIAKFGAHYKVLRNRPEDFYPFRDGVSHYIMKLHSDLEHPNEAVVTSSDYARLYIADEGNYFKEKLGSIFEMFSIFIIGHSLSDPDIEHILQIARKTASPSHPIYMITADATKAQETEYLEKYNIVLQSYSNEDQLHSKLRKLLSIANRFIGSREQIIERPVLDAKQLGEVQAAGALFLFRRLQMAQSADNLSPLVLSALAAAEPAGATCEQLPMFPPLNTIKHGGSEFLEAVRENLAELVRKGFARELSLKYRVTKSGLAVVQECHSVRDVERDHAYGEFLGHLTGSYGKLSEKQKKQCEELAELAIVRTFANRGTTIANKIFTGQSAAPDELSDIFGCVSEVAGALIDMDVRAAFIESMHQFIIAPSAPQRKYLAAVSQGYFLFHLLGLDPKCSKLRREIFNKTLWFCDSSVLLPLVATGCFNHEYSKELFSMLAKSQAVLYTTPKLLQEAWDHLQWAINFIKNNSLESIEFVRAALVKGSYKQNLFLDGFIRLSSEGRVGTFGDYLEMLCPEGINKQAFEEVITRQGIRVIDISEIKGFQQSDWGELEEAQTTIRLEREQKGTYRSPLQIESEAQIWLLVKNLRSGKYILEDTSLKMERVYFVSQSRILDRIFPSGTVTTWSPEAVYRYLSALSDVPTSPELLQQCMLNQYYYAGVSFIDKARYLRFFGPSIDLAKVSYEQEKKKYISEFEKINLADLDEEFKKIPDLEKIFFVSQMGWSVAESSRRREEDARQRASEVEAKLVQLEAEKQHAWKTRSKTKQDQEASRLRNLQDPRHVRKRLRQAKKRLKKKK